MNHVTSPAKAKKPSKNAKKTAARLVAAQLLYEHFLTQTPLGSLAHDYQANRVENPIDEEGEDGLIPADMAVLSDVFKTLEAHFDMFASAVNKQFEKKDPELLVKAILMAGAAELFTAADKGIDAPIIINDYLNVTRAFFNEKEVGLVNAKLDIINKQFQ